MGIYRQVSSGDVPEDLREVAYARKYTLYERGGTWYVNFVFESRQRRLSTGCRDQTEARALVEAFRGSPSPLVARSVDDAHLYKMMERSRYRNRNKGIPYALTIGYMRELVARCRGYCEVTGHVLEDAGPFRPSLDRINPALGYVPGNVRIVCLITNTAMLHYGEASFGELAIAYCRTRGLLPSATPPGS